MKRFRNSKGICLGIAALLIFTWLFAANHCALGAMGKPEHHSCCAHESSAGKLPHSTTKCCEALAVPLPLTASAPDGQLFVKDFDYPITLAVSSEAPVVISIAIGPAPPPGGFLNEYVLKRCIPANAPPVLA